MTATELAVTLGALAGLLTAGQWIARLGLRGAEQRKMLAEAGKAEADAGATVTTSAFGEWTKIVETLRGEVDRLGNSRDALVKQLEAAEAVSTSQEMELDLCRQALKSSNARVARLEAALPLVVAGERIAELQDGKLADLFDRLCDPLVITSVARDGMFLWVNTAFADMLLMTRQEVLALGWRKLVVDGDLAATQIVEGRSWEDPVEGFENHFRRKDGAHVRLRWYAAPYHRGVTLAIARPVGALDWPGERKP